MPVKIMGREETSRGEAMAQRVIDRGAAPESRCPPGSMQGTQQQLQLAGCCAHSQLLDYCVPFAPSRLLLWELGYYVLVSSLHSGLHMCVCMEFGAP